MSAYKTAKAKFFKDNTAATEYTVPVDFSDYHTLIQDCPLSQNYAFGWIYAILEADLTQKYTTCMMDI